MNCRKYLLLNYFVFLKAGPRKIFSFKPVCSAEKVADAWSNALTVQLKSDGSVNYAGFRAVYRTVLVI